MGNVIDELKDSFNDFRDNVREAIVKNANDSLIVSNNLSSCLESIEQIEKDLETNFNVFSELEKLYLNNLKKKLEEESQNISQKAYLLKKKYGDQDE